MEVLVGSGEIPPNDSFYLLRFNSILPQDINHIFLNTDFPPWALLN